MNKKLLTKCAALIAAGIMCNSIVVPAMADEVTNNSAPAAAVPAAPAADTTAAAMPAAPAADTTAAAVPAAPAADTAAAPAADTTAAADAASEAAAEAAANTAYSQEFAGMNEQAVEEQSLYTDVATTHWAYDSIKRCAEKAWFSGYPDGTFHPNGNITRGEAMKVFVVFLGITPTQVTESSYEDVSPTSWYAPYIEAGKGLLPTVTNFNGSAPFRPEMPVTREDTMYAIVTALGYASETAMADQSVLNMFSDKDSISEICKPYVTVGVSKKLISGYEDGRIAAQDPLTRAQFAAMLDRASRAGFAAVQPGQLAAAAASGDQQQSTDAASGKGGIHGVVFNALTHQPVEGANVTIDGITVTSDSAGVYKLDNVAEGSHSISAVAEGLEPGLSRVVVEADTVSEAEPMMMAKGAGTATLHGTVYDAANRKPVPEAKLIVSGVGREVVIYSDEKGEYSLQTPVGSYNVITTKTNYIPQTRTLVAQNDLDLVQDFTLSKILSSDQARFVLSWDVENIDLDMHLTGPTLDGNDRFHIWFNEKDYFDKTGIIKSIVNITEDDMDGYGPEILTIDKKQNGSYIVSVHDYTNKSNAASNALSTSGARLEVYLGGYLIKTYYVPSFKTGNLWTVCEFDGSKIIDINTVTSENEASYKKEEQEGEPTAEASETKSDASVIYKYLPDKR